MASNDKSTQVGPRTTGGLGGVNQDLSTGMSYDAEGNEVVREVPKTKDNGATVVQVDKLGVYDRHVYSDGSVATIQARPAENTDPSKIVTPVPLPGEKQDVAGTGQDAATKPKVAPGAKAADSK